MKTGMKTFVVAALAALAFAGCSSYSEIARWKSDIPVNDGEVPLASFMTQNFSYQLLWCIPLCTGLPWTEGNREEVDDFNVRFFADEATLDNNLASLNHAEDDSAVWSLFLVNRHEIRTQCLILKPEAPKSK